MLSSCLNLLGITHVDNDIKRVPVFKYNAFVLIIITNPRPRSKEKKFYYKILFSLSERAMRTIFFPPKVDRNDLFSIDTDLDFWAQNPLGLQILMVLNAHDTLYSWYLILILLLSLLGES